MMNLKNILLTLGMSLVVSTAIAEEAKTAAKPNFPKVPTLKKDEYAVFVDTSYQVFKTRKINDLEFDLSCFKGGNSPACEANSAALVKTAPKYKTENLFHPAALFCEARGGKNLIVLDHKRDEYNFCRFKDNSMVNSWSMYNKFSAQKTTK